MNQDWLSSFVVFADHLNLTHAAKALHITQPALHAQIRKLAEDLDVELYRREGRSLVLTPEGRELAAYGREEAKRAGELRARLSGAPDESAAVLAAGRGAFLYMLGAAMKGFSRGSNSLRALTLDAPGTVASVRAGKADVGVAALVDPPEDLECVALCEVGQQLMVRATHPLSERKRLAPCDLDGLPLIVAPRGSPHRAMLTQAIRADGGRLEVAAEATGWELMLHFVRLGIGAALVNDFCPAPRGLIAIPLRGVPSITYYALTRRSPPRTSRTALLECILSTVG